MSKQVLLALAAAFAAATEQLNAAAEAAEDDSPAAAPAPAAPRGKAGKGTSAPAPAPRAAVAGGGKPAGKRGKAAAPSVDFDTLKGKLMDDIVKGLEGGKDIAIACLDRFGAHKLSELTEAQYDEFNTYLDQVIAGEVDPLAADTAAADDDTLL